MVIFWINSKIARKGTMRLEQISNNLEEGNWVSKSLDGVEKRFPTSDIQGRDAWTQSYAKPQKVVSKTPEPKSQSLDLDTIWRKVEDVISNIFPDGDPIDWLAPWLQKQGVKDFKIGDILDQAAQKNGYNDIYDYYEQMKQQYSADLNEGPHLNTISAIASQAPDPKIGDVVRTKKMQMEGKVEKVEPYQGYMAVYFRTGDGRLMRTPLQNVTVIEKLADSEIEEIDETLPYDIDHMPGGVDKGEFENKTIRYFYNEWKELADRANSEQYNNGLVISSGPKNVIYQGDDGTIYAQWDKEKKIGFIKGKLPEGSMGGINRSAPAQDVSYEKVLDEVMGLWKEACRTDELSVDTMRDYRKAATSPAAVKTRPLRKLAKSVVGVSRASDKIAAKTGDRTGNNPKYGQINRIHTGTFEERLAEFLNVDEDFTQILQKQHDANQQTKKKPVKDIPFHGWTIRYRPAANPGEKVSWLILNKKHEEVKRGESFSDADAVRDAEDWIKSGGGTKQDASSSVTIDFNVDFAKEFTPDGDHVYVDFDQNNGVPVLFVSLVPQQGFKKTHIRNRKDKVTATTIKLPVITLSAKDSNSIGLQPNGRYILGDKDQIDNNTSMFPLIFQGIVQGKGDLVRLGKPGLTVAHNRDVNEVYQGPWQGDPEKYAKSPKSTTYGKVGLTLSQMVQDTIDKHGVKWAFNYYVKKHGMPPRHFRIYSGI